MCKTARLSIVSCACLALPSLLLGQGTFFLKEYKLESSSFEGLLEQQARWLSKVDKPEELKGLPKDLGKRVYYYSGEVAGRTVIALINSGKTRQLYVDLDGDLDLSDEKPVTSKRVRSTFNFGWSSAYRFGPLSFAWPASQPAEVKLAAAGAEAGRGARDGGTPFFAEQLDIDYLIIRPAVCRRGTIRIDEKSYNLLLTDGNYDGLYNGAFKFPLSRGRVRPESIGCDLIALDFNRNGQIDYDDYAVGELQPLTRMTQIQGTYYSLQVEPDGKSITLDEAKVEMGTIDLGKQDAELVVRSENGVFQTATRDGKAELPVGKYRIWHVQLRARDEKKGEWTLRGQAPDKESCEFEVQAGKASALKVGPPLKMTTNQRVQRTLLSGRVVSFGVACVDGAGIEYQAGADRGRVRGPAPSVKIFDEAGKTVSVGKFEYG